MKGIVFFIIIVLSANIVNAQTTVISGKVTGFNIFPLKNIHIKSKKAKAEAITNENGTFTIDCYPNDVLIFEANSCVKRKQKIKGPTDSVIVNMIFKTDKKSKEYAIGYGIIKEENLIYGISSLSNRNDDFGMYTNIYELIRAKLPEVSIENNEFIIRGKKSLMGSNSALIVLDGIAVNDISNLSPGIIKSITILKDSATSDYGSRGANGVILITTKRGND